MHFLFKYKLKKNNPIQIVLFPLEVLVRVLATFITRLKIAVSFENKQKNHNESLKTATYKGKKIDNNK